MSQEELSLIFEIDFFLSKLPFYFFFFILFLFFTLFLPIIISIPSFLFILYYLLSQFRYLKSLRSQIRSQFLHSNNKNST